QKNNPRSKEQAVRRARQLGPAGGGGVKNRQWTGFHISPAASGPDFQVSRLESLGNSDNNLK
ncbi:MAG TPA: hypothetical protein VN795_03255, partial [Stellaceae bacterium]|nr:hypothetical protein [Stellaceae bacterium]